MTVPTLIVLLFTVVGVIVLPRRWAPVPLLIAACYIPRPQALDLGPLSFTTLRVLTAVALARALIRGDWKGVVPSAVDYLMLLWAALMIGTVVLHRDPGTQAIGRLGLALDGAGVYFVFRLFCRSREDIVAVCSVLAILLVPLAVVMVYEKFSASNLLSFFGGVSETPLVRDGRIRARGPFRHAILAGTVGALSVPLMAVLWPRRRTLAALGVIACLCIVVSSTSSGPFMSLAAAIFALGLWRFRGRLRVIRWTVVGICCVLAAVMSRPFYYVITWIDLTGSSTSWHRARLIEMSITHLNEWWLAGTDYTRHWMPTGVAFSADHTDLTNHYIALGVYGGMPLLLAFLAVMMVSFAYVGRDVAANRSMESSFLSWAIGSTLFAIAVTSVSVSYFDQSLLWLYMTVAFCAVIADQPSAVSSHESARLPAHAIVAQHRARRRLRQRPLVHADLLNAHRRASDEGAAS